VAQPGGLVAGAAQPPADPRLRADEQAGEQLRSEATPTVEVSTPAPSPAPRTASCSACAIIGPVALGFARRYKINPLANRPDTISEQAYYKQILNYAIIVTLVGPLLVWGILVLPGW
jgi:hypothetical protein